MEQISEHLSDSLKELGVNNIADLDFAGIANMLPIKNKTLTISAKVTHLTPGYVYWTGECLQNDDIKFECASGNKTDVAAMLLEWCIENGYVKVEELNNEMV